MNFKQISTFAAGCMLAGGVAQAAEQADLGRWYVSPGVGVVVFEHDQPARKGAMGVLRVGYDFNERLSFELGLMAATHLENDVHNSQGVFFNKAALYGGYGDVLLHLSRWERFDPYLALGAGYLCSDDRILPDRQQGAFSPRVGVGAMWHLNDSVSLRADARAMAALNGELDIYPAFDVGMVYRFGGAAAPATGKAALTGDTDGDGLSDADEARLGTNPRDRDSDKDGLTDGEEVNVYKTNPLNADSDYDLLKDGPEVKQYKTNPLDRDTDKGGVYDGHEVLEDNTNPLVGSDDLMMFELMINFEYDQTVVKPEYIPELAQIVKVLQRNPEAKAKIEGHADRKTRSSAKYNQDLSEQRAKKVMELLVAQGVDAKRLTVAGFGFQRPKVQPDLVKGNPENRRVEVFLLNAGGLPAKDAMLKTMEPAK